MPVTKPNAVVTVQAPAGAPVRIGNGLKLSIIAGPCQLESRQHALETATALKEIATRLGIGLIVLQDGDLGLIGTVKMLAGFDVRDDVKGQHTETTL